MSIEMSKMSEQVIASVEEIKGILNTVNLQGTDLHAQGIEGFELRLKVFHNVFETVGNKLGKSTWSINASCTKRIGMKDSDEFYKLTIEYLEGKNEILEDVLVGNRRQKDDKVDIIRKLREIRG